MSAKPHFKVYNDAGEYVAACKHVEDAACLVSAMYPLGSIRWQHRVVVWENGVKRDGDAGESYDQVAAVAHARIADYVKRQHARAYAGRNNG